MFKSCMWCIMHHYFSDGNPVMILVRTDHPYLRVRHHNWYQNRYEYNTSRTVLLSKAAVRIRLNAHIRTIVVLTGGNLTGIYFLYLLSAIYFL
jgi:hypothetical protein